MKKTYREIRLADEVGIKETDEGVWLLTFMDYDL